MQPLPDASKYLQPHLPAIVRRDRLMKRLKDREDARGILLLGQAAQGKTTLAADYLDSGETSAAWLHLDAEDGDCAHFFTLLIQALIQAIPDLNLDAFGAHSRIALGTSGTTVRYEARLEALWAHLRTDHWIVIDGLDQLAHDAPAFDLIRHLMNLSRQGPRLLMTSRGVPPFPLQQWAVRQQLLVVNNEELAFTPEETRAYFETVHGLSLHGDLPAELHRITGGWPGGLVLLTQAMERIPEKNRSRWLADRLPDKLTGETVQYFSEEIFGTLPSRVRELLIQASTFEVIDPRILDGLLGDADSSALLDDLVARNLFIQSFDDDWGGRRYRLNRLFRRFLRSMFEYNYSKRRQKAIFQEAAERFASLDQWEKAIRFWFKAGEIDAAAAGIRKIGLDWVIRGRIPDLSAQLKNLPLERIRSDPWIFLFQTLSRRTRGGIRSIKDFQSLLETFTEAGDTRGQMLTLAYLIEAQIFLSQDPAVCREWIQLAERCLAEQSAKPYYAYAKALLWMQIGFGYVATGLDVSKGLSASQNAYLLARRMDDGPLMVTTTLVSVLGLSLAGEFEKADAALKRIDTRVDTGVFAEYHALRSLVDIELSLHKGDLEIAGRQLKTMGQNIETFGLLFLYPAYVDASGRFQVYNGDFETARGTSRHLVDLATLSGNDFYRGLAHRLAGLSHYHHGRYGDAEAALQQAMNVFPDGNRANLHFMRTQQLFGLVLMQNGQFDNAEKRLREALDYFDNTANAISLVETHLASGLLYHARGEHHSARRHLVRGFTLAKAHRFDHFVMLRPKDVSRAVQLAAQWPEASDAEWLSQQIEPEMDDSQLEEPSKREAFPPSNRAQTAASIDSVSGPEILEIRTFGGFRVLRGEGDVITQRQWGGNRPRLLLKAILVRGIREVPKELLMDDLWPDSSSEAANRNFKVTLHRLRRILEPDLDPSRGSIYIRLKDNLVSLDRRFCRIDMEDFLRCCKDVKRFALTGEAAVMLELGRRVMALYRGDFLPEEPYAPWVEMKRWALREEYIAVLLKMADIYIRNAQPEDAAECCRACLQADPCAEKAGRMLMELYVSQGQRTRAVQVYKQLCTSLKSDVGVEPEPKTEALYKKIADG